MKYLSALLLPLLLNFSCTEEKSTPETDTNLSDKKEITSEKSEEATSKIVTVETNKVDVKNEEEQNDKQMNVSDEKISETLSTKTIKEPKEAPIEIKKEITETKEIVTDKKKESIHQPFTNLLSKYVSKNGDVDYLNFKKDHNILKTYIKALSSIKYKSLSKDDQLAFLINLYNALTLDLILKNYPIKSITDLPKAWDTPVITYQGNALTLNDIEHKLIRGNFKEPRIHFACNCAAKSCPKLLNEAYEGTTLNKQLEAQTISFFKNSSKNRITDSENKISKLFEWYGEDFGDPFVYIKKYRPEINTSVKITYLEYDWALNKK